MTMAAALTAAGAMSSAAVVRFPILFQVRVTSLYRASAGRPIRNGVEFGPWSLAIGVPVMFSYTSSSAFLDLFESTDLFQDK